MKFEVGDKVVVKHSNEEGDVVEILNDKMVLIDVRGVKFPAYTDQLDFPYFKRFTEKKLFPEAKPAKTYIDQVPKEKEASRDKVTKKTEQRNGVWLLMFPVFSRDEFGDEVVDSIKTHLVNGTETGYNFDYRVTYQGLAEFELKNQVFNHQDFYLHDLSFEKVNDNPIIELEFSLITPDKKKAPHFETNIKLRPKQVFKKIEEIKASGDPSFSYKLFDQYPDLSPDVRPDAVAPPSVNADVKLYNASHARKHLEQPKFVIDLHMEKLADNWQHLSNFEILTTQMKEFEKYYDLAYLHHQPSLTVIHGVGSGRLRDEIHDFLKHRREVKTYINQYHSSYGYGATEIYFGY